LAHPVHAHASTAAATAIFSSTFRLFYTQMIILFSPWLRFYCVRPL